MSSITICGPDSEDHVDYVKAFRRVLKFFLILSTVFTVSLSFRNQPKEATFQLLNYSGTSAHSNLALFVLNDCVARSAREKIFREGVAKEKKDKKMTSLENYGFTAGAIITTGAFLTEGWVGLLGIPTAYYFISWEREISNQFDQEMRAANDYFEEEQSKCVMVAEKVDEELRYADESERNIHFSFESGSIQYNFLDISPVPNGSVTLEHIRGN